MSTRTTRRSLFVAAAVVAAAIVVDLAPRATAATLPYQVTSIGILPGGTNSRARGVNASGQVAGFSSVPQITSQAVLFDGLTLTNLAPATGVSSSFGQGINASGQVTGNANFGGGDRAFVWTATGGMVDVGVLPGAPSNGTSFGNDVNDLGVIAGISRSGLAGNPFRPFTHDTRTGTSTDLGSFADASANAAGAATAINGAGFVTGNSANASNVRNAFLYDPTTGTMTNLGTLGGTSSFGLGINDANVVVGFAPSATGVDQAFLYDPTIGTMIGLGTLGTASRALDVNNSRFAVGYSDTTAGRRATLFAGGSAFDLNALLDGSGAGWTLLEAHGINDRGQIVGEGRFNGQLVGFVLTPIPEPSSLALVVISGLLGLGTWRLRGRAPGRDRGRGRPIA